MRRLRRRFPFPAWTYLLVPLGWLYYAAGLAWLLRDQGWAWAAEAIRIPWLIGSVLVLVPAVGAALLGGFVQWSSRRHGFQNVFERPERHQLADTLWSLAVAVFAVFALWRGCVDWAIAAHSGGAAWSSLRHVLRVRDHSWRDAVRFIPSAAVALTILTGSPVLFAAAAAVSLAWPYLLRPSMLALLREKRDRRELLRHEREECGGHPGPLLRTLCEFELWNEALEVSKSVRPNHDFERRTLAEYLAHIRAGRGNHKAVLQMIDAGEVEPLKIVMPAVLSYLRLGKPDNARGLAEKALKEKKYPAGLAMGAVVEAEGDLDEALRWYEWEWRHWSSLQRAQAPRAAARMLLALEEPGEALLFLRRAVAASGYLHREDVLAVAECYRCLGRERLARKVEAELARCGTA